MHTIHLSVRDLVSFVYQSGDLSTQSLRMERAQLGTKIHQMLQKQGGDDYQKEVYLKQDTILDEICFQIDGRADGIFLHDNTIVIDEIKSVTCDYEDLQENYCFLHWAQVYCYAYMYAKKHDHPTLMVQLTYYQIDLEVTKVFRQTKTFAQLETFYLDTLHHYYKWALWQKDSTAIRNQSIAALPFPFPQYRKGQRELMVAIYRALQQGNLLFAQAPTGIGKTISTLFPALKALQEEQIEKIFYITGKNITLQAAFDTLLTLNSKGLRCKSVWISAKDKICCMEERNCDPQVCPYAKGYYDRLPHALYHLLTHHDTMHASIFKMYAHDYQICPFELSLDASLYSDIILCDYNYVFDPRVALKRYFSEKNNYALLIDEAHNMVERCRSMYSASLNEFELRNYLDTIDKQEHKLRKALLRILRYMEDCMELCQTSLYVQKECPHNFCQLLQNFQKLADEYLEKHPDAPIKDLYFSILSFLKIADYFDDHFETLLYLEEESLTIKLLCLNPCRPVSASLQAVKTAVFFSATLTPLSYFTTLLIDQMDITKIAFPSPFPKEHAFLAILPYIDTRYAYRQKSIPFILTTLKAMIDAKPGNYIAFFPSYAYLQETASSFQKQYPDTTVYIQTPNMQMDEKEIFLSHFQDTKEPILGFCVLGGMFSEGIDFKGDQLSGCAIIGVGLPQWNEETNLLKTFFDETLQHGYAFAYTYPGMNKVLQAAGRVIRTMQDKGVILFCDHRYLTPQYQALFPSHMQHTQTLFNVAQLHDALQKFWTIHS